MSFGHCHYVPCLRWKQGEYKAVSQLSDSARDLITPLIEVPEKGFDFETWTDKKSLDEHLAPIAKRVKQHWADRRCFVDLNLIPPNARIKGGSHPLKFVFNQLRAQGCFAVPTTGPARDTQYQLAVVQTVEEDKRGLCVRISIEEAAKSNLKSSISSLLGSAMSARDCDLVLDLAAPNFLPLDGIAKLIEMMIRNLPSLEMWRTFTVMGTSFPANMGEVQGNQEIIPRNEWLFYKLLAPMLMKARIRVPAFGDYVINHPEVTQMDMRLVKPSGTIRYAIDDAWLILKGPNVRDYGFGQYVGHCQKVCNSSSFSGPTFSAGDKYIFDCAAGNESTGNLSTWRRVGTNRHLEKVARDVATFFAVLSGP